MIEAARPAERLPMKTSDSASTDTQGIIADLRRQLAECTRQLDERAAERNEALEEQTATAEVLQRCRCARPSRSEIPPDPEYRENFGSVSSDACSCRGRPGAGRFLTRGGHSG
jgi:hypothetical protein